MHKKLKLSEYFFVGSMLFGMFFGAGNLIFPVHMGQLAGAHTLTATIGFVLAATGLPFLGVLAIGLSGSKGLLGFAGRLGKKWGYFFTILLYLTIGPLFAFPRTGTVSYEIGFALHIPEKYQHISLLVFSILFFGISLIFALRPGKLLTWIGKVLTPLFLCLIGVLILVSLIHPMGRVADASVQAAYAGGALTKGFTEGYNTMDALASLAFGVLVVDTLKRLGVKEPGEIAKSTAKAGFVSVLLMVIIYGALAYIGATSANHFATSENGGIALAQIAKYYLGSFGSVLLALLVSVACLKTAIGLTTSCAEAFVEMFPHSLSYRAYAVLFTVVGGAIANVGLTQIIALSLPVLHFLYPLAIVLIVLTICGRLFGHDPFVYRSAIAVTMVFGLGDALLVAPAFIVKLSPVAALLRLYAHLPLAGIGMGWVLPALAGILLGIVIGRLTRLRQHSVQEG